MYYYYIILNYWVTYELIKSNKNFIYEKKFINRWWSFLGIYHSVLIMLEGSDRLRFELGPAPPSGVKLAQLTFNSKIKFYLATKSVEKSRWMDGWAHGDCQQHVPLSEHADVDQLQTQRLLPSLSWASAQALDNKPKKGQTLGRFDICPLALFIIFHS